MRLEAASAYAKAVNASVPGNCGILTLPVMAYPNNGPVVRMDDYDHLLLGLTNPEKSFSAGALRGTPGGEWEAGQSGPLTADQAADLRSRGFCGIHVDTFGYEDPASVTVPIRGVLRDPAVVGGEGRWEFYRLT